MQLLTVAAPCDAAISHGRMSFSAPAVEHLVCRGGAQATASHGLTALACAGPVTLRRPHRRARGVSLVTHASARTADLHRAAPCGREQAMAQHIAVADSADVQLHAYARGREGRSRW